MSLLTVRELLPCKQKFDLRIKAMASALGADRGGFADDPSALPDLERQLSGYAEEMAIKHYHQMHRPWVIELTDEGLLVSKRGVLGDKKRAVLRIEQPGWADFRAETLALPAYRFIWRDVYECANPQTVLRYTSPLVDYRVYVTGDNEGLYGAGWYLMVKAAPDGLYKYGRGRHRINRWFTPEQAGQAGAKELLKSINRCPTLTHRSWKPHLWHFNELRVFVGVAPLNPQIQTLLMC